MDEQLTLMGSRSSGTSSLGLLNVPLALAVFPRLGTFLAVTVAGLSSVALSLESGGFLCSSTFAVGLVGDKGLVGLVGERGLVGLVGEIGLVGFMGEIGLVGLVGEMGRAGSLVVARFVFVVREAVGIEVGAAFARLEERVGAEPDIVQEEKQSPDASRSTPL